LVNSAKYQAYSLWLWCFSPRYKGTFVLHKKGKFALNILAMINGRGASISKTSLILSVLILAACSTTRDANIDRDGLIQSELVRPNSASQEALPAPVSGIENTKSTYYYSDIVAIRVQGVRSGLGDTLTFEEALSVVWQDHPKVIKALTELEATDYDLNGAKTGYYPYLSVTSTEASNDASSTQVNLVQPIWDGGLTTAQVSGRGACKRQRLPA
jgi:hypothetical protein